MLENFEAFTSSRDLRLETFGFLVNRLAKNVEDAANRDHWGALDGLITSEPDPIWRARLASCAVSALGQTRETAVTLVQEHLAGWATGETSTRLNGQLAHIAARIGRKKESKPLVIGVFSQKGGVGKTTLALATSYYLSKYCPVALIELDFGGPSLCDFPGIEAASSVNALFDGFPTSVDAAIDSEYLRRLPRLKHNLKHDLAVWPSDLSWEGQALSTMPKGSGMQPVLEDQELLDALVRAVGREFPAVVLDLPAEFTNVSRSACGVVTGRGGVALLVSSVLFGTLGSLLENYARLLATGASDAALVLNRLRPLDIPDITGLRPKDRLLDLLSCRSAGVSLFGLRAHSLALIESILGREDLSVLPIRFCEEIEAGMRDSDLPRLLDAFEMQELAPMAEFVRQRVTRIL